MHKYNKARTLDAFQLKSKVKPEEQVDGFYNTDEKYRSIYANARLKQAAQKGVLSPKSPLAQKYRQGKVTERYLEIDENEGDYEVDTDQIESGSIELVRMKSVREAELNLVNEIKKLSL